MFVGRDWQRKGGPTLLRAFAQVRKIRPNATLTIAGCTPDVGAQPGIKVVGDVPEHELPVYCQQAAIFCLPTHLEPFGIATIEAMHYGLPVLTTNIGAMPDFVDDGVNGYMVNPGNDQMLAAYMLQLLQDPQLAAEMGHAAQQRVDRDYTWSRVAQNARRAVSDRISL